MKKNNNESYNENVVENDMVIIHFNPYLENLNVIRRICTPSEFVGESTLELGLGWIRKFIGVGSAQAGLRPSNEASLGLDIHICFLKRVILISFSIIFSLYISLVSFLNSFENNDEWNLHSSHARDYKVNIFFIIIFINNF